MRKLTIPTLSLALVVGLGACQRPVQVYSEPAAATMGAEQVILPATATNAVPAGTTLQASLDQRLSTEATNVNDTFTLTLQTPVVNANRQTVIPAGARINGRVTAVRQSLDVATPAILRLEFQNIQWQNQQHPFTAEIVETEVRREGRTADDALRGAAAGAAAGAVIGAVVRRDVQGALAGAAIGAGAGTVISLGTANQQAVLDTGTAMTLRVTEPIPFR
ncbi:hypothetical protein BH23GEM3_BH23GEM3_25450 [soil metagenome]